MKHKKRLEQLVHLHHIGHGRTFAQQFFGITKINGIHNAIDQVVCVCVLNFEDVQTPQMLNSLDRQILVFGDNNTNVGIAPFANCDSP
jgi:hypothetical protein